MKKFSFIFRSLSSLLLAAGLSILAACSGHAAELDFPSIDLSDNSNGPHTTIATSNFGTLLNTAVLQFTTTT